MSVNGAIAERFERIARLLDVLGADRFKAIAHDRAARAVQGLPFDLGALVAEAGEGAKKRLMEIEGVGPKIAEKIVEFVRTGAMRELDDLTAQVPAGVLHLMSIPGLGPKTAGTLWKEGGVTDLAGLKRIIDDGTILNLPRMGAKSVEKLRASLALADEAGKRLALGLAVPVAEGVVEALRGTGGVDRIEYAGSLRRGRETVADIDVLVATRTPDPVVRAFTTLPGVGQVLVAGPTRASVRMRVDPRLGRWSAEGEGGDEAPETDGPTIQVDLKVVPVESWGAALMYFTGSKDHNVRLRERALKRGMTLNEYGLFPDDKGETPPQQRGVRAVAAATEEEVYAALGLPWIPPELREDRGELSLTQTPRLIEVADIKAELHAHTIASDGAMTIEELATRAKERGFHTVAVTDHSKSSVQANGLSVDRLLAHVEAVHAARSKVKGIRILAGSEVDILADGRLDYDDKVLAKLDLVVASPHTALSQEPKAATARLLAAIENPHVDILGHPTGRLINRRAGLEPDIAAIAKAAATHGVAFEINANWMRLDLRDVHVRAALVAGCSIAINCDTHDPSDLDNLRFGVLTGRRGGLTPASCVNAWTAAKLQKWLGRRRN
ncbi:MAG: PHP domain-containing protein [Phycisphaerae bacterium]|nr:PHP domain-containing protein [Phycisphaerae bacterium]